MTASGGLAEQAATVGVCRMWLGKISTRLDLTARQRDDIAMAASQYLLPTSHAGISVRESDGSGPAVLLLHGNSSCKEVFRNQFEGDLGARYRLIAIDLPGHGRSSNALNPARTYSMPGYADMAVEVLGRLGVTRFAVLGWSLGGHNGLEMFTRHDGMAGLLATGTPPVSSMADSLAAGFLPSEHMRIAGAADITAAEAEAYARRTCGDNAPFALFLLDAARRTDGQARARMFAAFGGGLGADQRHLAETIDRPLAIVSGGDEAFVNNDYLRQVRYRCLWDGQVHVLPGIGHAPFWEAPQTFDPIFARFLGDVLGP